MVKNPYGEKNFEIEKSMSGSFLVRSDSKRFGERAIVYENPDRNCCVDYIEERQPAEKPIYYVIENLHEFTQGKNKNIIYATFEECLDKYRTYTTKIGKNAAITCTIGVTTGKNDMDLLYYINGVSYMAHCIAKNKAHNTNKYILHDVRAIIDNLNIKNTIIVGDRTYNYIPLAQLESELGGLSV